MVAYIALGGIVGTLARYFLQGWVQQRSGLATFPVGTLAINLLGSFVIGMVIRLATGSTLITPDLRAALTIGFCGAFTTMSTFSYESMTLLADGEYWHAGLYMGSTVIGCLAAVIAGTDLANRLL
jgi:fluoride exporter